MTDRTSKAFVLFVGLILTTSVSAIDIDHDEELWFCGNNKAHTKCTSTHSAGFANHITRACAFFVDGLLTGGQILPATIPVVNYFNSSFIWQESYTGLLEENIWYCAENVSKYSNLSGEIADQDDGVDFCLRWEGGGGGPQQ